MSADVGNRPWVAVTIVLVAHLHISIAQGYEYGGGTGQPGDPYLICTPEQMNEIGLHEEDWDRHFLLTEDLDLGSYVSDQFNTIGRFKGVFDGNGHTISNFSFVCVGQTYVGLFQQLADREAEIKNVVLIDANIRGDRGDHVGSLVGYLGKGTIVNCHVIDGNIFADRAVGGLVGSSASGVVTNCSATGDVRGTECVGGLVGMNIGKLITGCCASGTVKGDRDVGGLVGTSYGVITNCYGDCQVTAANGVGGLVGHHGLVARCGSLEISMPGTISCCYSLSRVTGGISSGALVGASPCGDIVNCFWDIQAAGVANVCGTQGRDSDLHKDDGGRITSELHTASTFLEAGWDFVGETENGVDDIWWIFEGEDYPRLCWELLDDDMTGFGQETPL